MSGGEAGLTQMAPVSIPKDSLRVSGLKDIQEHGAERTKTNKMVIDIILSILAGKLQTANIT